MTMPLVAGRDARTGLAHGPDYVVPQDRSLYTDADHATWATLHRRQIEVLKGRVFQPFFDGLEALRIRGDGVPDFATINRALMPATGWRVVAVPGLVPDDVFFTHLAERRFPAGWWIRQPHEIDYIEEPDVFHDVFGHVPLLMNKAYADFVAAYGQAGLRLIGTPHLAKLARLYWYSVEFALIETAGGPRIFGAGIASSPGETVFSLESPSPNRVGLDMARVMRTTYRIDDYQKTYFVLRGFDDLPALDAASVERVLAEIEGLADLAPGDLLATDRVLARGTGAHHRGR